MQDRKRTGEMHCIKNPFWPVNSASGSRSPWSVTPCKMGKYPYVLPLWNHSFLSVLSLLAAPEEKVLGRMEISVRSSSQRTHGRDSCWVGMPVWVCVKTRFVPEKQGWACSPHCKVAGTALLAYTEHGHLELLNNYLIIFSWAKAKASIRRQALQYRRYCCFVKFFNGDYRNCTRHLWNMTSLISCVAKMGWGKRWGENAWFLLIKMIDYYSVG